jgi:hypothetical protein
VRLVLAVLRSRCAGLPVPVCLAADTSPLDGFRAFVCFLSRFSNRSVAATRDHSQAAVEQPPIQMSFDQQEPIIARMSHQLTARLHQLLLQGRHRPILNLHRQRWPSLPVAQIVL